MPGSKHSSSKGHGRGHGHGTSSKTYIWVWYCENCNTGPLNCSIDAQCTNPHCQHTRCGRCTTEQVASHHHRKSAARIGP
ncbi:hypothetical protein C8035_v007273 [Colletotrichum spinosum]|uniref:Uncharacterized protein n=1 Tax=Colletotrichum spinosum TaxID=1347390 RepID=A0A4R8QHL8_9PEZI|nr:hypothetical protein C8035_v007273 [Colletotrichum spinosum]